MTADEAIAAAQADPQFKALPAAEQARVLAGIRAPAAPAPPPTTPTAAPPSPALSKAREVATRFINNPPKLVGNEMSAANLLLNPIGTLSSPPPRPVQMSPKDIGITLGALAGGVLTRNRAGAAAGASLASRAMPPLLRIGATMIGGATGGAADPESTAERGAVEGAAWGVGGEALAPVIGMLRRAKAYAIETWSPAGRQRDLERFTKGVNEAISWVELPATKEGWNQAFIAGPEEGRATNVVGRKLAAFKETTAQQLGDTTFNLPSMPVKEEAVAAAAPTSIGGVSYDVAKLPAHVQQQVRAATGAPAATAKGPTFSDVDAAITELQGRTHKLNGAPLEGYERAQMRTQAGKLSEEFVAALNDTEEGLGDLYRAAKQQYHDVITLDKIVRTPGALSPRHGYPDYAVMHKALAEDPLIVERTGTEGGQQLVSAAKRGEPSAKRDITMTPPHGIVHAAPSGKLSGFISGMSARPQRIGEAAVIHGPSPSVVVSGSLLLKQLLFHLADYAKAKDAKDEPGIKAARERAVAIVTGHEGRWLEGVPPTQLPTIRRDIGRLLKEDAAARRGGTFSAHDTQPPLQ